MDNRPKINRRDFFKTTIAAIGALIGSALGIPAIAYIVGPALQTAKSSEWLHLGSTSKIETGVPTLFKTKLQLQTGWITNEEEITVYALTENGRDFIAMSNICTHLGCHVRWIGERNQFFCPCHNGIFNKQGEVVSGPPPRPLDRYAVKVENDQLYIQGG
ncbi:MAG: ubiquinol-cytochrome c reductase iron-sulfur subunit [Omnitrophica WOR_2 bacterium]